MPFSVKSDTESLLEIVIPVTQEDYETGAL